MKNLKLFLKGIIAGIGGVTPGLSGSVLMVILGIYTNVINAIATLFKNFKKNFLYLLPVGIGILLGIVIFSRLINYSLEHYEVQTRLAFLGLLIGTIPLFYNEVQKKGDLKKNHYIAIVTTLILGFCFLTFSNSITAAKDLNIFQAFVLGFIGISATIIPGIDSAAVLSSLGMYGNWLDLTSVTHFDLSLYVPAGVGLVTGAFLLSIFVNKMLEKNYTLTFSLLFGFFLSIIPSVLKTEAGAFITLANNTETYIGILLFIVAIIFSYFFSKYSKKEPE